MVFVLSKLFWTVAQPATLLWLILLAGLARLRWSRRRHGIGLLVIAALGFGILIVLPVGDWAIAPLEQRFPPPAPLPAQVEGIVLLGGAVDVDVTAAHDQVALNDAAERITATLALARRYPAARIVVSGGNGSLASKAPGEAAPTARLLTEDGLDPARLVLEDHSRTTFENAVQSQALVEPKAGETWLLVTSAAHMPRAVGCFRHVGWEVVPYPVDYRAGASWWTMPGLERHLATLDLALHEWIGLVAYRMLGRIDSLFPGPSSSSSAR
jgi:uncharacterized SAM-binding protein YcdF (DUF218 family)